MSGGTSSLGERLYRLLLRLYPARFRRRFGPDLLEAFREQRQEPGYAGPGGAARFWLEVLWDLAATQREAWRSHGRTKRFVTPERPGGLGPQRRWEAGVEGLRRDIAFGMRSLLRAPGFAVAAVFTLAIGIGSNAAIFGVVNAVLLRPLPYGDPDGVATIWSSWRGFPKTWVSIAEYQAYVTQVESLQDVALWSSTSVNFSSVDSPERVAASGATPNLVSVLDVDMAAGRWFTDEEALRFQDLPTDVVVISHEAWARRYDRDPGVVGRRVEINGRDREIVGVLPDGFRLPTDFGTLETTDVFLPMHVAREMPSDFPEGGGSHGWFAAARLRPGATVASAKRDMDRLIARLDAEQGAFPAERGFEALIFSAADDVLGGIRPALLALLGTVVFVLLIACANVANLMLTRSQARQGELAVRVALGAGRGRIVQQVLTESLLLGAVGGGLGLVLAYGGIELFKGLNPGNLPRIDQVTVNGTVLAFGAVVTIATVALFAALPALRAGRTGLQSALSQRREGGLGRSGWQGTLVVSEMALAVTLVMGAVLMLRTFNKLAAVDVGFDGSDVVTMAVSLPTTGYPTAEDAVVFHQEAMRRMEGVPGVQAASAVRTLPLASQIGDWGLRIENFDAPEGLPVNGDWQFAAPGYFEVMGIPIVRGRSFEASDDRLGRGVTIVNEAFVRHFWPGGEDPIGQRIAMRTGRDPTWMTIVGVARDVTHNGVTAEIKRKFYIPMAQWEMASGGIPNSLRYVVKTAGNAESLMAPIRNVIRQMDPTLAIAEVQTVERIRSAALAQPRFTVVLMASFSLIAISLALIGIYGVISYGVTQRLQEIGIRMALGAERGEVVGMMVREGAVMVALGLAAGVLISLGVTRSLESLLYDVEANDPVTFALVATGFAAVAWLATYIPSRRAGGVDPIRALKAE